MAIRASCRQTAPSAHQRVAPEAICVYIGQSKQYQTPFEHVWHEMAPNPRHDKIVQLLEERGEEVPVDALVKAFGVSDMTIRRDLVVLEEAGQVERTWGGARIGHRRAFEYPYHAKNEQNLAEKKRIGEKAASLIEPGSFVFVDTGTTTVWAARALAQHHPADLHVITCSFPIVSELFNCEDLDLVMLGGTVRAKSMELYGPLTERNFGGISADIALLGVDAVNDSGELLTAGMETARLSELIMKVSRKSILLADASKFGAHSAVRYGWLRDVDTVVTDSRIDAATIDLIESSGASLVVA
ncbi:MAG: DeoR family transcriptional regulator [Chitinivibrionales bacterium]|nr:DeoR family transcriptional regulator [Chitinivibrionales bacterium]